MPAHSANPYRNPSLPVDQRVADLLGRMTLEEKIAQLSIYKMQTNNLPTETVVLDDEVKAAMAAGVGAFGRPGLLSPPRATSAWTNAIQKFLREETRLGIPAFFVDEALHGLMAQGCTSFPQAIGLASTWDPDLVRTVFTAVAREMRARGENYALSPVLDLAREPRWGRTEETYGEDPCLGARMGAAAVRGLQGEETPIGRRHVLATAKHFAVHGQPEGGRNCAPANLAEREIRENFLPAFQAAVEAGVGSVMASYNEVNGVPVHINRWLLDDILRGEWGFGGFVTSDGGGIEQLHTVHGVAASRADAARLALESGIDFELDSCFGTLTEQVRAGRVPERLIDAAAGRVLRAKFLLGLFDDPYADPDEAERTTNSPGHRRLAFLAACKSLILLKNDGLLPLDAERIRTLAVIGPNAAGVHPGGYSGEPGHGVSVLDGIRRKAGRRIEVWYAEGCKITANDFGPAEWRRWGEDAVLPPDPAGDEKLIAAAVETARRADVVVLAIGENESVCREGWSETHRGDRDSLDLPGRQEDLVEALLATGTPVVVLLINGRPLAIPRVVESVPAVFEGWYLGQEGGTAFAEALFGDVNPGGKLPITFPRSTGQIPAYYNHKPSRNRSYLFADGGPLFPFGHGLSYTTFQYGKPALSPARIRADGTTVLSVEVTNAGRRAGDEVVQMYIRDCVSSVTRPVKELKDFRRISLPPGGTRKVEFTVSAAQLSFLDLDMRRVVEPGIFDIMVGTNSVDLQTVQLEVVPA
jgi:beta-glucosidase